MSTLAPTTTAALRGDQFIDYFSKVPHVQSMFLNVVAINEIPKTIPIRNFLICNLSLSHLPGSHWISIVRPEKNIIEIFNSLGYQSLDSLIPHFKFPKSYELHFNIEQFQEDNSISCGYFCIYFLIHRVLNYDMSFEHILNDIFDENKNQNEELVRVFCNNLEQNKDTTLFI